jgi:hypothetical protein
MKCQCQSSAHGHRPGHCAMEPTIEGYCPRCHAEKGSKKSIDAKPESRISGGRPER